MNLGLSLGLGARSVGSSPFSPLSLFAAGEQGYWLDPSDFSTMFQGAAGTTPVTAVGQSVRLMLDKSQGLTLGPERVTNGTFNSDLSGWSIDNASPPARQVTWTAGGARIQNDGSGNITLKQPNVFEANKSYRVTFTVTVASGGIDFLRGSTVIASISATGSYSYITGGAALERLAFVRSGVVDVIVDNISVRELAGNHFTQANTANAPILGVEPFGGRRNLLTFTEQFDNAAWAKTGAPLAVVTPNVATAPDGTTTADRLVANAGRIQQTITLAATDYVLSCYMKADGGITGELWLAGATGRATFDLSTGVVASTTSGTASITDAGNGWYRCIVVGTSAAGSQSIIIDEAGSGILIWGAQLETGSTATAYQRVTTAFDVTQAGVADCYYVAFDGSDDWLQSSATINPGAVDKAQVFAGVRKLSDAAVGVLLESSPNVDSGVNTGSFGVLTPGTTALLGANDFRSRGSLFSQTRSVLLSPSTFVLAGLGDIGGDVATLRFNGSQVSSSTADQGTGNYLTYTHFIGRRGGTTLPFNGRIYQIITRYGANLTADQIAATETFVNQRTGAF